MNDIVTSLHGREIGLDATGRLVVRNGIVGVGTAVPNLVPGGTDNAANIQASINALSAAGGGVLTIQGEGPYEVRSTITVADNVVVRGDPVARPTINLVSSTVSTLFSFSGAENSGLENLILNGANAATSAGAFIALASAVDCWVKGCEFVSTPDSTLEGSVRITGTSTGNRIEGNTFTTCLGSAIGLTGSGVSRNLIRDNLVTDAVGFGVVLGDFANTNEISQNRTYSNGIELVGIKESCSRNLIANNYAQGCGDNGISISGFDNVCVGNICYFNDNAGIWIWGSGNVVTGNHCRDNNQIAAQWAGIGISANFGGTGQYNVVTGNVCEDTQAVQTQFNSIRIGGNGYTAWGSGAAVTQSSYRYNGLNLYIATNSGTTGVTAPTHTSGVVSDGAVSWRYVRSFATTVNSVFNQVFGNVTRGGTSAAIVDASTGNGNFIMDANLVSLRNATGNMTLGTPTGSVIFVGVNNADQARFDSNVFRPEVDNAYALGLTNRRFSNIHANAYSAGASGSTVQVVGARRTGWTAATGTATRTTYDTATVTTAQLAERVKALLDDLIAHGLIGT